MYNTPMNTTTIVCFQLRKKIVQKSASFMTKFKLQLCFLFTQFREKLDFVVCKQQRHRSACAEAQSYQFSLESMIANSATCKNKNPPSDTRARIQTIPTLGGGGVKLLLEGGSYQFFKMGQPMFLRGGPDPQPPVSLPISEFQTVYLFY